MLGALSFGKSFLKSQQDQQGAYAAQLQDYYTAQTNWEINKRQADDRKRQLNAAAVLEMQQLEAAQMETNEAAAEEKSQIVRDMMKAKAQAELAASEAGVGGNSVDRILADINFTEQSKLGAVESTRENRVNAFQTQKHGVRNNTQMSPIYAALGEKPDKPSILSSLLSGAVSGVSTYAGLTYNPYTQQPISQVSSYQVRNPRR